MRTGPWRGGRPTGCRSRHRLTQSTWNQRECITHDQPDKDQLRRSRAPRRSPPSKPSVPSCTRRPACWMTASSMSGFSATTRTPNSGCRAWDVDDTSGRPRTRRTRSRSSTTTTAAALRTVSSGSRRTGPRRRPFRSPAPGTTSRTSRSWSTTAARWKVRFNWFTLYFRYNTTRTRTSGRSFYTIDLAGGEPVDPEEEGRPEERLHPPRGGRLPRLVVRRNRVDGVSA